MPDPTSRAGPSKGKDRSTPKSDAEPLADTSSFSVSEVSDSATSAAGSSKAKRVARTDYLAEASSLLALDSEDDLDLKSTASSPASVRAEDREAAAMWLALARDSGAPALPLAQKASFTQAALSQARSEAKANFEKTQALLDHLDEL